MIGKAGFEWSRWEASEIDGQVGAAAAKSVGNRRLNFVAKKP
jgi:hypothetical protein